MTIDAASQHLLGGAQLNAALQRCLELQATSTGDSTPVPESCRPPTAPSTPSTTRPATSRRRQRPGPLQLRSLGRRGIRLLGDLGPLPAHGAPGQPRLHLGLGTGGAPALLDKIAADSVAAISDIKVNPDGKLLMFSTGTGPASGLYLYSLADPGAPVYLDRYLTGPEGVHTAKRGEIDGR